MRTTLACTLVCLVAVRVTVFGSDPGIPDTIRIECDSLITGRSMPAEVSLFNDEEVFAYDLCFLLQPLVDGWATIDSVVYVNRLADPQILDLRIWPDHLFDGTPPDLLGLAAHRMTGQPLPPGSGVVILAYLTGVTPGTMEMVAGSYPPVSRNAFDIGYKVVIYPVFVGDTVSIVEGEPLPTASVSETVIRDVAGEVITLEVSGESPVGYPVELQLASFEDYDDETRDPANAPTLSSGNPAQFEWQTTAADVGIWVAGFQVCDSAGGCVPVQAEIQLVDDEKFLVAFDGTSEDLPVQSMCMSPGNFDGDAEPEVFIGGLGFRNTQSLAIVEGDGAGSLQSAFSGPIGVSRVAGQIGHFNDDMHLDAVIHEFISGGKIRVWYGDGNNTLTPDDLDVACETPRGSTIGEFTGDQYLDFATVAASSVSLFAGNSEGRFDLFHEFGASDQAYTINAADFNGDGYDDLAVGTSSGLAVFVNDGDGTFTLAGSYGQTFGSVDMDVTNEGSDFNNDGEYDLVLATPSIAGTHSEIMVYLGNGDGTFVQTPVRYVKGQVLANRIGDFNGDGDLDVAYVNGARDYLAVMFGDGNGAFTNELRYHDFPWTLRRLACLDMDLDGDIDIILGAFDMDFGEALVLLENQLDPAGFATTSVEIVGEDNALLELESPTGRSVSRVKRSMPAAEYYRFRADADSRIDDCITVNVVEAGEYTLTVQPKANLPAGEPFSLEFDIDGQLHRLAVEAPMSASGYRFPIYPGGVGDIWPPPGRFVYNGPPTFDWPGTGGFDFQLATDIEFTNVIISVATVSSSYTPEAPLPASDTALYYWRVKPTGLPAYDDDVFPVNVVNACCEGVRGNVNDDPDEQVNIVDLTYLVSYLFAGGFPPGCPDEANVNGDGEQLVNIVDLTYLVAYLFAGGSPPAACP